VSLTNEVTPKPAPSNAVIEVVHELATGALLRLTSARLAAAANECIGYEGDTAVQRPLDLGVIGCRDIAQAARGLGLAAFVEQQGLDPAWRLHIAAGRLLALAIKELADALTQLRPLAAERYRRSPDAARILCDAVDALAELLVAATDLLATS
jgi:hypothetical protein